MAGLFALSINPETHKGNFLEDLFWGTFYQQHLGEEYSGLSTYNVEREEKIKVRAHQGLFRPAFNNGLEELEGTEGIGYCGGDNEPYLIDSRLGKISICFSGNLINLPELLEQFKSFGRTFERGNDVEMISELLIQGEDICDGIKKMTAKIKGAYSLLILTNDGIYAVRSPDGHWPLIIGEKDGAVAVASDPSGFRNLGFKFLRDLEAGEIILIKSGSFKIEDKIPTEKIQFCSFMWVYTAFANGVFEKIPASLVRKKMGAALARQDIEKGFIPDVVIPVPDSGRYHAIGYHQEFCRQMNEGKIKKLPLYDEGLVKYAYAGRSYLPQNPIKRAIEANIKLLGSSESYQGLEVAVCDDSIVRGGQTKANLVPKLRALGIKGIHFRISNPELHSYCPWGKTTKRGELLVNRFPTKQERIDYLKVESLEYNTIEDLIEAIGLPREWLCIDCDLSEPQKQKALF